VQARLVVGTLCIANGAILVAVGALAFVYVDGTIGKVVAALLWFAAGVLWSVARRLRHADAWDWPTDEA